MTNGETGERPPAEYCERIRLLLSLQIDGEATPAQVREVAEHVPDCADCRAARAVDQAVRAHMEAALATIPPGQIASLVLHQAARARSAGRFAMASAAAAVLIAVTAGLLFGLPGHPAAHAYDSEAPVEEARTPMGHVVPTVRIMMPGRKR